MPVATDSLTITGSMQSLIDARLDTIDRMLVGRVPRQDRLAIVREVESQIHDLLAEHAGPDLDREAVIAVLARLDPPEAYLPDESGEVAMPSARVSPPRIVAPSRAPSGDPDVSRRRMGRVSGILGLVAIALVLLAPTVFVLSELSGSMLIFWVGCGFELLATASCAVLAVGFSAYTKVRGPWAITGLVTGLISALIVAIGTICLVLRFVG